ncbi:MAG: serine/threonine-protein kinase [Vicinamibacterales bacterium]
MPSSSSGTHTRLLPDPHRAASSTGEIDTGLHSDLVSQSASRLQTLALLYAFTFFMAGLFPALIFEEGRTVLFATPVLWITAVVAIIVALGVAAIVRNPRVSLHAAMTIGLVFEVAGSYGIAASEFLDPLGFMEDTHWQGLSWVAVWTLLFTVVIPTPPRRAVIAALASVSSVPVAVVLTGMLGPMSTNVALQVFFGFTFPYLLVVMMAYVGARVVYGLGKEVSRARELGSYELVEKLGQGGMGEVWRAKHRLLARPAAIKLIRAPGADGGAAMAGELRRRFELEANTIAALRSPHTVNLYDFGVAGDGAFYYVMELLDGLDADSMVRRSGALPAERVIFLLRQICHSLSEAESRGLVHRDIKPANIFLCRYGEEFDFVKVLDFGIVKALHQTADTRLTLLTMGNEVRGTPAFIAPEQALGATDIDGRADLYSMGCVAYWLLTGELVFTADTQMGLLIHHAHTPPVLPSQRTTRPIPPALEELVMACLEKDPAKGSDRN